MPWVDRAQASLPGPVKEHWGGPKGFKTRGHIYMGSSNFHILKTMLQLQHTGRRRTPVMCGWPVNWSLLL